MRIPCPFCGLRDAQEFSYLGDATRARPEANAPDTARAMFEYVYLRDNPAGPHHEYWQHVSGCRAWLILTRDTRTHEILKAAFASQRHESAP
ncbi:MAG TPA: sarcosine oxidase subunit delta [Roseiarcus sp.]|nr:sarcosine oxidase subunit delta [Roseiarcus sp.]